MGARAHLLRAPASSTLLLRRRRLPASSRRPRATSNLVVRAEYKQEEEEVPAAARIFATGVGLMINAAGFAACYELNPSMRILAGVIEETQNPALHTFFAKVGTIFASPVDVFLLTICLLLIEISKWFDE